MKGKEQNNIQKKISKDEFLRRVNGSVEDNGIKASRKDLDKIFNTILDTMINVVKESGKFTIKGFGTFYLGKIAARQVTIKINGKKEKRAIGESVLLRFRAGANTKKQLLEKNNKTNSSKPRK